MFVRQRKDLVKSLILFHKSLRPKKIACQQVLNVNSISGNLELFDHFTEDLIRGEFKSGQKP